MKTSTGLARAGTLAVCLVGVLAGPGPTRAEVVDFTGDR